MSDQLHIMITRDRGRILRFPCTTKKLGIFFSISLLVLIFLLIMSIFSASQFRKNLTISSHLLTLQHELKINKAIIANYMTANESEKQKLNLEIASLKLNNAQQSAAFKKEKEVLLSTAVSELQERAEIIKRIMNTIGITLDEKKTEGTNNSGGPFIPQLETDHDDLLYKADKYLKRIQYIPLGAPVKGKITSRFGKRKDPVNQKKGFHTGLDFRGKRGEKIHATADGIVKKAFKNGGYGNYILISHGNGYTTSFAHLQAFLVKKGDRVKRGQLIGLVGNTGRSTGPHLHYEINLDKKPINPSKFLKFSKLMETDSISSGKG